MRMVVGDDAAQKRRIRRRLITGADGRHLTSATGYTLWAATTLAKFITSFLIWWLMLMGVFSSAVIAVNDQTTLNKALSPPYNTTTATTNVASVTATTTATTTTTTSALAIMRSDSAYPEGGEEDGALLGDDSDEECYYIGTEYIEVKIYLIGVFAACIAICSLFFNAFFTCVFVTNKGLRDSPLFYIGVLAILDTVMAVNYLALMAVPVYMDQFNWLWLYHIFLSYLRPMLTLSNVSMFASVLLILMATLERFLRATATSSSPPLSSQRNGQYFNATSNNSAPSPPSRSSISSPVGERLCVWSGLRRCVESHRPLISAVLICASLAYKLCVYFEIQIVEHPHCTADEWTRYEVGVGVLAMNPSYHFWWMFVTRNLLDRIAPFLALVVANSLIVLILKREHKRSRPHSVKSAVSASIRNIPSLLRLSQRRNASQRRRDVVEWARRKSLRDATRILLAIVSMYLMAQTPQVLITIVEAFWREWLEARSQFYSYLNDAISIVALLASALRYPVYFSVSQPIREASKHTLWMVSTLVTTSLPSHHLCHLCSSRSHRSSHNKLSCCCVKNCQRRHTSPSSESPPPPPPPQLLNNGKIPTTAATKNQQNHHYKFSTRPTTTTKLLTQQQALPNSAIITAMVDDDDDGDYDAGGGGGVSGSSGSAYGSPYLWGDSFLKNNRYDDVRLAHPEADVEDGDEEEEEEIIFLLLPNSRNTDANDDGGGGGAGGGDGARTMKR